MSVARMWYKLVNVTTPPTAMMLVVPCKAPLPAVRVAVTTVLLSLERKLPNWSSIRITGWGAKTKPAVALGEGCVRIVSRFAAAGPTVILLEFVPVRPALVKAIVIVSALL